MRFVITFSCFLGNFPVFFSKSKSYLQICLGYLWNEEGTRELIDDEGWVHSGELELVFILIFFVPFGFHIQKKTFNESETHFYISNLIYHLMVYEFQGILEELTMMGSFMFVAESRNLLSLLEVKHSPFDISSSIPEQQFITKNDMLLTFFYPTGLAQVRTLRRFLLRRQSRRSSRFLKEMSTIMARLY